MSKYGDLRREYFTLIHTIYMEYYKQDNGKINRIIELWNLNKKKLSRSIRCLNGLLLIASISNNLKITNHIKEVYSYHRDNKLPIEFSKHIFEIIYNINKYDGFYTSRKSLKWFIDIIIETKMINIPYKIHMRSRAMNFELTAYSLTQQALIYIASHFHQPNDYSINWKNMFKIHHKNDSSIYQHWNNIKFMRHKINIFLPLVTVVPTVCQLILMYNNEWYIWNRDILTHVYRNGKWITTSIEINKNPHYENPYEQSVWLNNIRLIPKFYIRNGTIPKLYDWEIMDVAQL